MIENEYRVRPVRRYVVTHFISEGADGGSSCQYGEFPNIETAEAVATALHRADSGSTFVTIEDRREPTGVYYAYDDATNQKIMKAITAE